MLGRFEREKSEVFKRTSLADGVLWDSYSGRVLTHRDIIAVRLQIEGGGTVCFE